MRAYSVVLQKCKIRNKILTVRNIVFPQIFSGKKVQDHASHAKKLKIDFIHELSCNLKSFRWHCGREHTNLDMGWQQLENIIDLTGTNFGIRKRKHFKWK